MEIQRVNAVQSKPVFNGYLDKSVVKYVKTAVSNSMDAVVEQANNSARIADKKELERIKNLGDDILFKLENFIKQTHRKTSLKMVSTHDYSKSPTGSIFGFEIKNPLSKDAINFDYGILFGSDVFDNIKLRGMSINIKTCFQRFNPKERELALMNRAAEALNDNINPKDIDKAFLDSIDKHVGNLAQNAKNFFSRWNARFKAYNAENYAYEVNMQPGHNSIGVEDLIRAGRAKRLASRNFDDNKKSIAKRNQTLKNQILNG